LNLNRIVLNTLVLEQGHEDGNSQAKIVTSLLTTGIKKIELRREYGDGSLNELKKLNEIRLKNQLVLFYSVPDNLFVNGRINPEFIKYVSEAKILGVSYIKMTLGDYSTSDGFKPSDLLDFLPMGINLNIENDQTKENTNSDKLIDFFDKFKNSKRRVGFVNDLGNWIFVQRDAYEETKKLAKYTRFIHIKNYVLNTNNQPETVAFDKGKLNIDKLVSELDEGLPIALEYPTNLNSLTKDLKKLAK